MIGTLHVLEEAIVRLEAMFSVEVLSVEVDGVSICVSWVGIRGSTRVRAYYARTGSSLRA